MELECEKYKEKVDSVSPVCRHPNDFCQYRTGCIINFMEKENKREEKKAIATDKDEREKKEQ
ncbi:MAG TPA: hypothetical protein ENK96_02210 [Desulfobulbaceae bacterium]|nr:hypothetical protein [Desulfobulbaceae bacterium]